MADVDITLTNNANSKQFKFRGVSNFKPKRVQPAITIPFVSTGAEDAILFRFTGQTEDVTWTFALFDDSVDVSNGDGINTVEEQITYLRDNIFTEEFDTSWSLTSTDGVYSSNTCVITNLDVDRSAGKPSLAMGTITVRLGTIGAL